MLTLLEGKAELTLLAERKKHLTQVEDLRRREDTGGERVIPQTVQAWQRRPGPPVWVWPGSAATAGRENRQGRETTTKMFKRCLVLFFSEKPLE